MKKLLLFFLVFASGIYAHAQGCGTVFTDTGGTTGNYSNNENITWSICPSNPGDFVSLSFTSFDLENNVDFLNIYNGVGPTGSGLGTYTGSTLPPTITSTDPSGCLTVVFTSDALNSASGWIANVTCAPPADCFNNPVGVTAVAQTDTTLMVSWQNALGNPVQAAEVLVQPHGYPAPTATSSGIVANTTPYFITGLAPNTCYDIYVRNVCIAGAVTYWVPVTNVCTSDCQNTGQCSSSAVLIAFLDANGNGIKDTGEDNFPIGNFQVSNTNNTSVNHFSINGTAYIPVVDPSIGYDFSYTVYSAYQNYYNCSTTYSNITIPLGSGTQYYYFPVTETQPYSDVYIAMNASAPRPGFPRNFYVNYYNQSISTTANGTITFTKSTPESIISVSDPNAVLTPTGFTLDYTNLMPFQTGYINVQVQTPPIPTVNLGDILTTSVAITSDLTENNLVNNSYSLTQTVEGSYDPNEIQEQHGREIVWNTFTANDYLYYTISFENTGTANASFIRIEDLLDAQLNPETIELVASSHDCQLNRTGNNLVWHFYNINLPATATNPDASHGYVTFRIKPTAGYAVNDIIPNTAQIYFDYNPAIITNTWETKFVDALSTQNQTVNSVKLYPNPASNTIRLSSKEAIDKITIYDAIGKEVLSKGNYNSDDSIDIHTLENGFYLIEVTSQNKKSTLKFLKK